MMYLNISVYICRVRIKHHTDDLRRLLVTNLTGDEFLKARNHLDAYNQFHPEKLHSMHGPVPPKIPDIKGKGQIRK